MIDGLSPRLKERMDGYYELVYFAPGEVKKKKVTIRRLKLEDQLKRRWRAAQNKEDGGIIYCTVTMV